MYLDCGAKESDIYFRHLSDHAEIYYIEWPSTIKFKSYKKKNSCIWLYYSEIAKKLKIQCENNGKIEFEKIEELSIIKPYIQDRVNTMNKERKFYNNPEGYETGYKNLRTMQ